LCRVCLTADLGVDVELGGDEVDCPSPRNRGHLQMREKSLFTKIATR